MYPNTAVKRVLIPKSPVKLRIGILTLEYEIQLSKTILNKLDKMISY